MLVQLKPASEAEGRRFNSYRARQTYQGLTLTRKPFCFVCAQMVPMLRPLFVFPSLRLTFSE